MISFSFASCLVEKLTIFCNHVGGPRDPLKKRYSLSDSIMHLIEDHGEMVKYLRNKSETWSERYNSKHVVYITCHTIISIKPITRGALLSAMKETVDYNKIIITSNHYVLMRFSVP